MLAPRPLILGLVVLMLAPAAWSGAPATAASSAPAYTNYAATGGLGTSGGEPTLGVDPRDGNVYLQAYAQTLRLVFDDSTSPASATWADVSDPNALPINFDPILFTDAQTGRTWAGGLELACSAMSFTDDGGATWNPMANPCALPGIDHQTVASGPWHAPAPLAATYPRALYYCVHEAVEQCAVSLDGGVTFLPPVTISPTFTPVGVGCGGYTGKLRVAPDGSAFITSRICTKDYPRGITSQGVMVTQDNGLTWSSHLLPATGSSPAFEPSVATTPSSWAYAAWTDKDNHTYVSLSKDHAATWSAKTDLTAGTGIRSTTFSTVVAGDDDRAIVSFLGTTTPGNAFASTFNGVWDLYIAHTYDAGVTWTVTKATQDPVQRGWVCTGGANNCPATGEGRNLLDFITAVVDAKGRVLIGYADGCTGACALPTGTAAQSTGQLATIARQTCGPSLYAAQGDVQGAGACPTTAPPTPVPAIHQVDRYANAAACGVTFDCTRFAVPPGATSAHIVVTDDINPHVGAEWCLESCSNEIGLFCDWADVDVTGMTTLIVVPNAAGFQGAIGCILDGPSPTVGQATSGAVTVDFS